MRLVTWNINGLRAIIRRKFGSIKALLESLEADIVCFQETKLTKTDFDRDIALVDGWQSFFSFYRNKSRGYSGVATFCRTGTAVPLAAQEGLTGVLPQPAGAAHPATDTGQGSLASCYGDLYESFTKEELEVIDAEGRCLLTDHGDFVLGNIYAPAMTSEENAEERFQYRMQFYKALIMRLEGLRAEGRRVVLVGDYNITYNPIDHCEPGPNFVDGRVDRQMLLGLLPPHGPFLDTFRVFQPDRTEAYTCWSTASGARVNNYGSRIDLILVAEPCQPPQTLPPDPAQQDESEAAAGPLVQPGNAHASQMEGSTVNTRDRAQSQRPACYFTAADIWPHVHGSDHAPAVVDFMGPLPQPAQPPPLASCYTFTGKQGSLKNWLAGVHSQNSSAAAPIQSAPSSGFSSFAAEQADQSGRQISNSPRSASQDTALQNMERPSQTVKQVLSQHKAEPSSCTAAASRGRGAKRKAGPVQGSLRAFIAKPPIPEASPATSRSSAVAAAAVAQGMLRPDGAVSSVAACTPGVRDHALPEVLASGIPPDHPLPASQEASEASQSSASAAAHAWKQIQQRMQAPKCKGHNEDCVIRQVKKSGANQGRLFYVCNRPDGKPPQGRCDHFEWSGKREVRGQVNLPGPSKKRKEHRTEHV
ncbi:hypothetical protein WJX74_008240 [Apatococcus lobatus]|uniref:DNA-(apurinic or apyrimidinic site) endonuclease 2 n=1 Tax=Apatococcus lobatus TaxID=904363 RepID=A0AAW1RAT8_9CHLO